MPILKIFKALICKIFDGPLTSSKANICRFSSVAPSERRATNIFKNTRSSVVTIIAEHTQITGQKFKIEQSIGSGVMWDIEGHIVTSYHVIKDYLSTVPDRRKDYEVYILTPEGVEEKFIGKLVGINYGEGLVVLKITAPKNILKPITVGESTAVEVGQTCFAIGVPYGFTPWFTTGKISGLYEIQPCFTTGIISGLSPDIIDGTIPLIREMIQTNAYTNEESSGGPLLNYDGHMIGITTRGIFTGIGFAIPSSVVVKIIAKLIKYNNTKCLGFNM